MTRSLTWLLLAGLTLAAPGALAQPYVRTLVPGRSDFCVVWPIREYVYRLDAAGSLRTPGTTEFSAIEAAVESWRTLAASCTDYTFTRGPDISNPKVGFVQGSTDNANVILFRERDCNDVVPSGDDPCTQNRTCGNTYNCWQHGGSVIGLTTTTFSFRTGYVFDADIELNAAGDGRGFLFTTADSPPCGDREGATDCVAADVQNTLTHELGHVVGLDHVGFSAQPGSTMEATAPPGETHKRIIDVGSAAGFCDAYPRALPPTQCQEAPTLGRRTLAESRGPGLACGVAPEALGAPLALLLALGGGLRRRRGGHSTPPGD